MEKFIFKNISSKDMNVYIKNKLSDVPRAQKNVNKINIPGRNGCLFEDTETYKEIDYSIECNTNKNANVNKIKEWLEGSGELILDTNKDVFRKATIISQLDIATMIRYFKSFQVNFILQPFAYSRELFVKEYSNVIDTNLIITDATANMYPLLEIYGNEEVNITINKESIVINPDEYITLDCEMQEAYKDTENANSRIFGDLSKIFLKPGLNEIYIIGNYEKIKIKYRKAYL